MKPKILTLGSLPCFALLYADFVQQLGARNSGSIAHITGTYFITFSLVGLLTGPLFRRFGCRPVGLFGAAAFIAGSLLSVPLPAGVWSLAATYGCLQGGGFAIMQSVSFVTFNQYFVRRRAMMMGLAQTAMGCGAAVLPLFVDLVCSQFGPLGGRLIVAALNGHALLAMLVMRPVRHRRRTAIEIELNEMSNMLDDSGNASDPSHATDNSIWSAIVRHLDLRLLLDPVYVNIAVGMSFALYSDITFFTVQPLFLAQQLGYAPATVARIIAIGAAADLLSRFCLGLLGAWAPAVRARSVYLAGAVLTVAARLGE